MAYQWRLAFRGTQRCTAERKAGQYGADKRSSADVHSPGVILVILISRPMPPIRPFWLKTKA